MAESVCTAELTLVNALGLHTRPCHAVVTTAARFDAQVTLSRDGRSADARSILSVMSLGGAQGACVRVEARGPQAEQAVAALRSLFESGFEEGR